MDEDLSHMIRRIVAEQAAQAFMIDYLMRHSWAQLPREQRLKIADGLLTASEQTGHLHGIARNDELQAANLAEITERMQTSIDQYVGRALKAVGDAEDAALSTRGRQL
jgi:hypothetical protein